MKISRRDSLGRNIECQSTVKSVSNLIIKELTPTIFHLSRAYHVHLYRTALKASAFKFSGLVSVKNGHYFSAAAGAAPRAYRLLKRSTRPAVSTSFCLPVKNG